MLASYFVTKTRMNVLMAVVPDSGGETEIIDSILFLKHVLYTLRFRNISNY